MPLGPGGLDPNGIWLYGEDDSEALASDLLNLGMDSVSDVIAALPTPVDPAILQVVSTAKTDTFSASVTTGASVAVTGLSITHEVSNPSNKLLITAFFGVAATSSQYGNVGLAVSDGSNLLQIGDASGTSTRVTAGGMTSGSVNTAISNSLSATFLHTPGAGSKTYTVHAINVDTVTRTLYVNKIEAAYDSQIFPRGASALTIMEVAG